METCKLRPGDVAVSTHADIAVNPLLGNGQVDSRNWRRLSECGTCIVLSQPTIGDILYKYLDSSFSYYVTSFLVLCRFGIYLYASGAGGYDDVWDIVT
jgi:hypothetical protein